VGFRANKIESLGSFFDEESTEVDSPPPFPKTSKNSTIGEEKQPRNARRT